MKWTHRNLLTLLVVASCFVDAGTAWAIADTDIFPIYLYKGTTRLGVNDFATGFGKKTCDCDEAYRLEVSIIPTVQPGMLVGNVEIWAGSNCGDASTSSSPRSTRCTMLYTRSIREFVNTQSFDLTAKQFLVISDGTVPQPCLAQQGTPTIWILVDLGPDQTYEAKGSVVIGGYDGEPPPAPTNVATSSGDGRVIVRWDSDATQLAGGGFQILCTRNGAPAVAPPPGPSYQFCGAPPPFPSYDPQFLCTGGLTFPANEATVGGLVNSQDYQFAVVAYDKVGNPSSPSALVTGTPVPTLDLYEEYRSAGGRAPGGACSTAMGSPSFCWRPWLAALAGILALRAVRKKRRPRA